MSDTTEKPTAQSQDDQSLQSGRYPQTYFRSARQYLEKQRKIADDRLRRNQTVKDSYRIRPKITPLPPKLGLLWKPAVSSVDNATPSVHNSNVIELFSHRKGNE